MKKLLLSIILLLTVAMSSGQARFWTWSYGGRPDWPAYFQQMKDVGLDGIIIMADRETLEKIIPVAKEYGIEVQAWMWIMNNGHLANQHPEWLDYNALGESLRDKKAYVDYYRFLSPAVDSARAAIGESVRQLAETEGLAGISFDYCRYVDAVLPEKLQPGYGITQDTVYPQWDYGFHPEMVRKFKEKHNIDPFAHPNDPRWNKFRLKTLNSLVDSLAGLVRAAGKQFSASPFPTPKMSTYMVRQDWGKWQLDVAFPMIYHGFYEGGDANWVAKCVRECRRDMKPRGRLICGLYAPDFGNPKGSTLTQTVQAALDAGADGVAFFQFDNLNASQRAELKAVIEKNKRQTRF